MDVQARKTRSMKGKFILIILSVILAASLLAGTAAFYIVQEKIDNHFRTSSLKIDLLEEKYDQLTQQQQTSLIPNHMIDKDPKVRNTDQMAAFVFLKVTVPVLPEINVYPNGYYGQKVDYPYSGEVKSFTADTDGYYKLEAWGAQGGSVVKGNDEYDGGGKGGYSCGYVQLSAGDTIYIAVGGKGGSNDGINGGAGGWNGGGGGGKGADDSRSFQVGGGGGGGATHFAITTNRGELKNYISNKDEVLLVAGAGGGYCRGIYDDDFHPGGYGGGTAGQNSYNSGNSIVILGGMDDGYHPFGEGETPDEQKYYVSYGSEGNGGGGAGYYGGYTFKGKGDNTNYGGAGGNGYFNTTALASGTDYTPVTIAGDQNFLAPDGTHEVGHSGNGYARITYVIPDQIIPMSGELFYMKKSGTEKNVEENAFNISGSNANDKNFWIELTDLEEGTDYQSDTRTYVFGYSVYLAPGEETETLFDSVQLRNIVQNKNLSGDLKIKVEAFGIQADYITGIEKTWEGQKKVQNVNDLKLLYSKIST